MTHPRRPAQTHGRTRTRAEDIRKWPSLDQRIAVAMQIHRRASWRDLAKLVGTSESTVARRARRLVRQGIVRTTTMPNPQRCGIGNPVWVHFECEPSASNGVAVALASRPDVRLVAQVTGSVDIVAELILPDSGRLATVLTEELAKIPGILRTHSENVLRTMKVSHDWSRGILDEPIAGPAERVDNEAQAPMQIDSIDRAMLDRLRSDGRLSYRALAQDLRISESSARRRVGSLIASGCLVPVTLVEPRFLGFDFEIFAWLRVSLSKLEAAADILSRRSEVRYLAATSGYSDLVAEIICRSQQDLYLFRTQVLGSLPGLRQCETAMELRTVKRVWLQLASPSL
jgi:DNA-binding Lrp family transcriptional regulator